MTLCPNCDAHTVAAVDSATGERVLLDLVPVHGGRVQIRRAPGMALVALDHITVPAPQQPAFELHTRTCTSPAPQLAVDLDDDPVREQSGGWRR
jgi:hypothetical protein